MRINSKRLRDARKEKKLSQLELAKKLNVTQPAIQSLESGKVKACRYLVELAKELEVRPEWLMGTSQIKNFTESERNSIAQKIPLLKMGDIAAWNKNAVLPQDVRTITMLNTVIKISEKTFAIQVEGDAMVSNTEPGTSLYPGHIAIIDPERKATVGDYVLLSEKTDYKIRQLIKDGAVFIFKPLNERYPITADKIKSIIGVVIATQQYHVPI